MNSIRTRTQRCAHRAALAIARERGLRSLAFPAISCGVGEVRLDLGFNADGDMVFHLGVLPKMDAQRSRLR